MQKTPNWQFAWKFSFRSTGWLLAFISVVMLLTRMMLALARWDAAEAVFSGFEVIIPLIAGLHASLLFAPDDEPALELLLAAPRPTVYLIYERLAALVILQGGLALALTALAALTTPGANVLDMIVVWLPPAVCMIGRAKKNHDQIETYYVPHMDFAAVTERREQILQRILQIAAWVEAK